jgi:hypothetical protein
VSRIELQTLIAAPPERCFDHLRGGRRRDEDDRRLRVRVDLSTGRPTRGQTHLASLLLTRNRLIRDLAEGGGWREYLRGV